MPQNVLIIGATGAIGRYITAAIVNTKSSFGRISILTSPKTVAEKVEEITALESNGVQIKTGSLDDEVKVKAAYSNVDTVVACVGRNAIDKQIPLIKWAIESGVKRFFPSEYGTDIEYNPETSPHEPPHQLKLKVRAFIKGVAGKIEHTYVVTGPYSDMYFGPMKAAPEIGSFDVLAKKATLCGTGHEKVSFTTMGDVGKLVVAAMLAPDASRNATLIVNSFTCTPAEIAAEYQKQTGETWDVATTPLEKLRALEKEAHASGNPVATAYTLRRIWTEGGTLYQHRDNELLGDVPLETMQEQVRKNIGNQTGRQPFGSPITQLGS